MITNGNQSRIYEPETQNLSQRGIKAYQHVIFNLFKFILNFNETNEIQREDSTISLLKTYYQMFKDNGLMETKTLMNIASIIYHQVYMQGPPVNYGFFNFKTNLMLAFLDALLQNTQKDFTFIISAIVYKMHYMPPKYDMSVVYKYMRDVLKIKHATSLFFSCGFFGENTSYLGLKRQWKKFYFDDTLINLCFKSVELFVLSKKKLL